MNNNNTLTTIASTNTANNTTRPTYGPYNLHIGPATYAINDIIQVRIADRWVPAVVREIADDGIVGEFFADNGKLGREAFAWGDTRPDGTVEVHDHNKTFTVMVYLFDTPVEQFERHKLFCQFAEKNGFKLGMVFGEGETMFRTVFWSTPEDDGKDASWQNHGLPAAFIEAVGLNPADKNFAPDFLPEHIVRDLAEVGETTIRLRNGVRLRMLAYDRCGAHLDQSFKEVYDSLLEDYNNTEVVPAEA